MPDPFKDHSNSLTSPASSAEAIVPNDAADLFNHSRAIFVGAGGSLSVELVDTPGQVVTLQNVIAGMIYPLRVRKVLASGTSATDLVCFW